MTEWWLRTLCFINSLLRTILMRLLCKRRWCKSITSSKWSLIFAWLFSPTGSEYLRFFCVLTIVMGWVWIFWKHRREIIWVLHVGIRIVLWFDLNRPLIISWVILLTLIVIEIRWSRSYSLNINDTSLWIASWSISSIVAKCILISSLWLPLGAWETLLQWWRTAPVNWSASTIWIVHFLW